VHRQGDRKWAGLVHKPDAGHQPRKWREAQREEERRKGPREKAGGAGPHPTTTPPKKNQTHPKSTQHTKKKNDQNKKKKKKKNSKRIKKKNQQTNLPTTKQIKNKKKKKNPPHPPPIPPPSPGFSRCSPTRVRSNISRAPRARIGREGTKDAASARWIQEPSADLASRRRPRVNEILAKPANVADHNLRVDVLRVLPGQVLAKQRPRCHFCGRDEGDQQLVISPTVFAS